MAINKNTEDPGMEQKRSKVLFMEDQEKILSLFRTAQKGSLFEKMGYSGKMQRLNSEVLKVAPTDFSVLICGETGTGKELVGSALHQLSDRSNQKIIALDCGALPATLIESELFGVEKGAFTGADRTRPGKFEAALKGTLFLDEISNLPFSLQSKLLRVLQDKTFYRVGGNEKIHTDVRIIAATNEDLLSNENSQGFRKDLYYRLAEFVIHLPPLRERKEDLPFLVNRFIQQTNQELQKEVEGICPSALSLLMDYPWPGNVRELRNIIRKAVLLSRDIISAEQLGFLRGSAPVPLPEETSPSQPLSLKEIVYRNTITVERSVLLRILKQTEGNKAEAARILQIDYKTILTKLKKYGLYLNGGNDDR